MNKSKFLKKSLAAVLAVLMIVAMIPLSAAAAYEPREVKPVVGTGFSGEVTGSVTAREHLCLERTGSIHGDVSTCSLVVENGRLDGSSKMLVPPERPHEVQPAEINVSSLDFDIPLDEG